jgi:hypothetical protein
MKDITEFPYHPNIKLVLFDIENMYSNISTDELNEIIRSMCLEQSLDRKLRDEILFITRTVLE